MECLLGFSIIFIMSFIVGILFGRILLPMIEEEKEEVKKNKETIKLLDVALSRERAIEWWNKLEDWKKETYRDKYFRGELVKTLTIHQIHEIFDKEVE